MARVLLIFALFALCPLSGAQDTDFQKVFATFAEGRTTEALAAAEVLADPVERSQARTYVLYQCGDLGGAWKAASEGLAASPADLYLLEQIAELSVSLGAGEAAVTWSGRFQEAAQAAGRADREPVAQDLADSAAGLQELGRARATSMTRARAVAGLFSGIALLALGLLFKS